MNALNYDQLWANYVELPIRTSPPVKIDRILEQRMQSFLLAKKVKPHHIKTKR